MHTAELSGTCMHGAENDCTGHELGSAAILIIIIGGAGVLVAVLLNRRHA